MKLNFIKKTLLLLTLSLAIVSCDDDDQTGDSQSIDTNPTVTVDLNFANPLVFSEDIGDTMYTYTVTLSEAQIVDTRLYVTQSGGTADDHDYEMTELIMIPAGYTTGSGSITLFFDTEVEGDETLTIEVGDQRTANSAFTPVTVEISIIDYVFCIWNVKVTDIYGDGWNGGYIEVDVDGVKTNYMAEDIDGVVNSAETQDIDFAVTEGAAYTITYVSGGGTGTGPGWESENTYILTAPDGTVWADGPVPTAGVITSGTNNCP